MENLETHYGRLLINDNALKIELDFLFNEIEKYILKKKETQSPEVPKMKEKIMKKIGKLLMLYPNLFEHIHKQADSLEVFAFFHRNVEGYKDYIPNKHRSIISIKPSPLMLNTGTMGFFCNWDLPELYHPLYGCDEMTGFYRGPN